ncbi:MAG: DNA-binding protein [Pseudorhodobacter sp. PARRP1]|nr:MAG: DNA-binding protein [Pseudorhodobacter sp. PARRP1]
MSAFVQKLKLELSSGVSLAFWAGLIFFVALTGPFGTYAAYSFAQRFLAVTPLLAAIMLVGVTIRVLVFSALPTWRFRWATVLNAALASLIIAPMLDQFLHRISPADTVSYPGLAELMLLVFSLSLGLSSLRRTVAATTQPPAAAELAPETPAPEPAAPRLPRLLQRLDAADPGVLWSISVRDHYVDVQTSTGVNSLLMRLSDAIAETDPVEGAQIHRSHWVAWAAVQGVERDGAKLFVAVQGGARLPVSKNHRDKLVARGLL